MNGRRWTLPGRSLRPRVKAGHGSFGWRRKNRGRLRRSPSARRGRRKSVPFLTAAWRLPLPSNSQSAFGSRIQDGGRVYTITKKKLADFFSFPFFLLLFVRVLTERRVSL